MPSAHVDTFARDHLPPRAQWPEFLFERPELQMGPQLNAAQALLDDAVARGWGDRSCIHAPGLRWTYRDLQRRVDHVAQVLVQGMGLQPGQRVLLRAPNNPMLAACMLAVLKAGGIAVPTMPLLRAAELKTMLGIAQVSHALCDASLAEALNEAASSVPGLCQVGWFNPDGLGGGAAAAVVAAGARAGADAHAGATPRQQAMAWPDDLDTTAAPPWPAVNTAADDTCLLAFTSGTTGVPKATMHFHRDLLAACRCWPMHVLRASADDVFIGSPPLAFTFGLGGLLLFPMAIGASTVLLEKASPPQLAAAIGQFGATVLFTAPTSYRALAAEGAALRATPLRRCVSAGEALPPSTRALWQAATGLVLIDGIGATELLHIFISASEADARPGATGRVVPGYRAEVVDPQGQPLPPGQVGRLRVKGPTGCRYLADERQARYVQDGWNYTGDAYSMDEDGYFYYHARTDDMIVSAGYNIAAPEVEDALMQHPAVAECGVIGVPDEARGRLVKAFVVLKSGHTPGDALAGALQDHVKQRIAPYKYPRALQFVQQLPRTATGKLQRHRLSDWPPGPAASAMGPATATGPIAGMDAGATVPSDPCPANHPNPPCPSNATTTPPSHRSAP